jgi:hypothetical protein
LAARDAAYQHLLVEAALWQSLFGEMTGGARGSGNLVLAARRQQHPVPRSAMPYMLQHAGIED